MRYKIFSSLLMFAVVFVGQSADAATWDWTKIFGGGNTNQSSGNGQTTSSTLGNLLEGVFSRSDIQVSEMAGTWVADGSAVAFQSEDFLSKAGGMAAAAAIQTELDPYYQQYGLTGAIVTIDRNGNCSIKLKRATLRGIITRKSKGEFMFKITVLGQTLSSVPLYVRKTSQTMDMMFDVAKLKQILNLVATLSGNTLAKTVISILDKYDGVYVGFGLHADSTITPTTTPTPAGTNTPSTGAQGSGLDILRDILTGGGASGKKK